MKKNQIAFASIFSVAAICINSLEAKSAPAVDVQTQPAANSIVIEETNPVAKTLPWWIDQHAQNVQAVQNGGIEVAIYGDSITQFMNEQLMHKILGDKTKNLGIKGDRTEHLLWRLQNGELDFKKQTPKVAVVLIGTNNFFHSKDRDIVQGVVADVSEIRKRIPATKILVVGILPRGETTAAKVREKITKVNTELAKMADGKIIWYTDIGKSLLETDGSISKAVMDDFLHPTKEVGYTKMFEALKPEIEKVEAAAH